MKQTYKSLIFLSLAFTLLMSLPFLVPHCGLLALFAIVPLLCMEKIASEAGVRHFWMWHYACFVLWNAATTFWVCNATIGGGLFAIFANALQMSLIFGAFRFSKKYLKGILPYIFLATCWIAWERFYFDAQISWPWLVLGNAFAGSTWAVQWYEYTGALGGSLWIWMSNLCIFAIMCVLSDGRWNTFNLKARVAFIAVLPLVLVGPILWSILSYPDETDEDNGGSLQVVIAQPNIDPYNKFEAMSQQRQNAILLSQIKPQLDGLIRQGDSTVLILAPETFTSGITTNDPQSSLTWREFNDFLQKYPSTVNLLFGASTHTYIASRTAPSATARKVRDGYWVESHNSALMMDRSGRTEIFHKNKLVVGVEMTPFPKFFCKVDDLLGGVMGRCVGDGEAQVLHFIGKDAEGVPVGCAICYESVYGEYFSTYVAKGAKAMTVITNDAWWGDTPGYRQHLNYSRLRAIETRRAIARCANTGISAIISPSGEIKSRSPWWEPACIVGQIPLSGKITFFVRYGDVTGRVCTFVFILLLAALAVKFFIRK